MYPSKQFLGCFLLLFGVVTSLGHLRGQPTLYLHQLGADQDLSQSENRFFHQTDDGQVLISTNDGLNIFDGQQIVVHRSGLDNSPGFVGIDIQSDFFEPEGAAKIWFGTSEGLICYNALTKSFRSFNLSKNPNGGLHYPFFLEANRYLWLKANQQLFRFDTEQPELPDNQTALADVGFIRATAQTTSEGRVKGIYGGYWMDPGLEVYLFKEDLNLSYQDTLFDGRNGSTAYNIVDLLASDPDQLWLKDWDENLLHLSSSDLNIMHYHPDQGFVSALHYRPGEPFIYLFSNIGLLQFDPSTASHRLLADKIGGLSTRKHFSWVDALYLAPDETIWLGRRGEGVYFGQLINSQTRSVLDREELPFNYYKFWTDDYAEQVYSLGGFSSRENPISLLSFSAEGKLLEEINQPEIDTYFGTDTIGTYGLLNDQLCWRPRGQPLFQPLPQRLPVQDLNGQVFLRPSFQLFSIGSAFFTFDYQSQHWSTHPGLGTIKAFDLLAVNDQTLFVDHGNNTISIYPYSFQGNQLQLGAADTTYYNLGLVNDLHYDHERGSVWVASSKGLHRFSPDGRDHTFFNLEGDFPSQYIMSIQQDDTGQLWLSSNEGIFSVHPTADGLVFDYHFTARDGLSSNEFRAGASLKHPEGYLWFGSIRGFDVFHPDSLQRLKNPPQLLLQDIKIFDESLISDRPIHEIDRLDLPYWKNTLNFRLAAPEYTDPERTQFEVYLSTSAGVIDTNSLGDNYSFTLANLAPGNYRFGFNAASAQGVWAPEPHWLNIRIKPPFWKTWWFWLLITLTLFSGVVAYLMEYYRARNAENQRLADLREARLQTKIDLEEQRRLITSRIHNEMGGQLTTLNMLSSRIKNAISLDKAQELNERINDRVRETRRRFSSFLRAVNPQFDELQKSMQLLKAEAAGFLQDSGIQSSFDWPEEFPERRLPPEFRLKLFELIQEVLNNIAKSAEAQSVALQLRISPAEILELTILDDGSGFVPTAADFEKGIGLGSLQQISKELNGKLTYELRKKKGTRTQISLPLPTEQDDQLYRKRSGLG